MNGRRKTTILFLLLSTLLLSFTLTSSASAGPIADKKARLKAVEAKLQGVYQQADMALEKYNQAKTQLDGVRGQIKQNTHLLKVAEYNLGVANAQLAARALNIYKSRDVGMIDVLFSANSFDDLVTQMDVMTRLGNSDVDTVRSIDAYRGDIKNRRLKLDADKKAVVKLVAAAAQHKAAIAGVQNRYEQMTAGLKAQIKAAENAAAARARAAAQAAQAAASTGGSTGGSSSGGVITDPGGVSHSGVVGIAQQYLGVPYVYGGASPSGFDCSGLAMYCYAKIGISLSHGATDQQRQTHQVPISALQPGDLVFFGSASYSYHVGIYAGGGQMIDAPHTGAVVRYDGIGGAWCGGRP